MQTQSESIKRVSCLGLQQQTVSGVVRNTFAIYERGFGIFLTYLLPTLPFEIWAQESIATRATAQYWIAVLFSMPVAWITFGAMTISVSDICLGNAPSLARSYKRVFSGIAGMLLLANLLQSVIVLVATVLLIVPGVIASLWLLFITPVVVLEGIGGFKALKRSKEIAQGHNLRNLGVVALLAIVTAVACGTLGFLFGFFFPRAVNQWPYWLFISKIGLLAQPLGLIATVLLYYDLRARKESYDGAAPTEDLRW
jgi:hypothetical protein